MAIVFLILSLARMTTEFLDERGLRLVRLNGSAFTFTGQELTLLQLVCVQIEFSDQTRLIREVYAGGGYLSQNSSSIYFALPHKRRVSRIHVRWPDGAESIYDTWSVRGHRITIQQ